MRRSLGWALLSGVAVVIVWVRQSRACDFGAPGRHTVDPAEAAVDSAPPSAIGSPTFTVRRGAAASDGCGTQGDSCDDIGTITVHFPPATDDRTDAASMGYRVEVVRGAMPPDPTWPDSPVRTTDGRTIYFHWIDGDTDDQELIDVTLAISAVDRAGNEGPPTELRIRDAGSSEGCSVATRGADLSWAFLVGALGWRGRRASGRGARPALGWPRQLGESPGPARARLRACRLAAGSRGRRARPRLRVSPPGEAP